MMYSNRLDWKWNPSTSLNVKKCTNTEVKFSDDVIFSDDSYIIGDTPLNGKLHEWVIDVNLEIGSRTSVGVGIFSNAYYKCISSLKITRFGKYLYETKIVHKYPNVHDFKFELKSTTRIRIKITYDGYSNTVTYRQLDNEIIYARQINELDEIIYPCINVDFHPSTIKLIQSVIY